MNSLDRVPLTSVLYARIPIALGTAIATQKLTQAVLGVQRKYLKRLVWRSVEVSTASAASMRPCDHAEESWEGVVLAYLTNAGSSWRTTETRYVSSMALEQPWERGGSLGRGRTVVVACHGEWCSAASKLG